jgi:hypothetical protein
VIDGSEMAEALGEAIALDHGFGGHDSGQRVVLSGRP